MEGKLSQSYIKRPADTLPSNEVFRSNPKTFLDCIRFWANKHPHKDAVVFRSTTEPRCAISWKELHDRVCKMASAYIEMGIKPGEVIAICSRPCPEWLYVVFGAIAAGIIVTTIVFTYADGSDVITLMEKLRTCALLVLDPGNKDTNWTICQKLLDDFDANGNATSSKLSYLRHLIFVSQPTNCEDVKTVSNLLKGSSDTQLPTVDPTIIAILFQTSGSTGVPKLAAHTQEGVLTFVRSAEIFFGDSMFSDRPFGWLGGFPFGLFVGQTRVAISGMSEPPRDKLSFTIDVIQSERCNETIMLPPMIYELTKRHKDLPYDWPLKTVCTGGQPITKSITSCLGKVCEQLCVLYGSTEMAIVSILNVTHPDQFVDYSSGLPEKGVEVKIVDDGGEIVPVGERGEIYIRSEFLFHGYYNDREKTSQVKLADGWYKTDDYGRLNSDGYFFIEGRKSDIILSGGMTVTPVILEAVLKSHPDVESAIIIPVPDAVMYQVICACVMVKGGCDVTEDKLSGYMEEKHNDAQKLFTVLPTYYWILDKFPEESTGKVSRKTLIRMAQDKFAKI